MNKFLLDANISSETAEFLREIGCEVKSILEEDMGRISDKEVVKLAKKEKRIIITHDLDFGEIYHFKEEGKVSIIVLRLRNQTVEKANNALEFFLKKWKKRIKLEKFLVVVRENSYRVHK